MRNLTRRSFVTTIGRAGVAAGGLGALNMMFWGCGGAESAPPDGALAADDPFRWIAAPGLPNHETGIFPNPGCPFPIREQPGRIYRVARKPVAAAELTKIGWWEFGVAVNGVPFDPSGPSWEGDADSGWQFEVTSPVATPHLGLDMQHAHVQPSGAYHYHAEAPGLLAALASHEAIEAGTMLLAGWAADGFPIYAGYGHAAAMDPESPLVELHSGYRLRSGARQSGPGGTHDGTFVEDYLYDPSKDALDEANGRFGVTPEYPDGTYHYMLTAAFPYIPRLFRGTPDPTFGTHSQGPGLGGLPPALRGYHG